MSRRYAATETRHLWPRTARTMLHQPRSFCHARGATRPDQSRLPRKLVCGSIDICRRLPRRTGTACCLARSACWNAGPIASPFVVGALATLSPRPATRPLLWLIVEVMVANAGLVIVHVGVEQHLWQNPISECSAPQFSNGSAMETHAPTVEPAAAALRPWHLTNPVRASVDDRYERTVRSSIHCIAGAVPVAQRTAPPMADTYCVTA
jgi:Disulfide bond formation protein DsbB